MAVVGAIAADRLENEYCFLVFCVDGGIFITIVLTLSKLKENVHDSEYLIFP